MDLEEARRIIGVLVNDFGNEGEGKAWDMVSKVLNERPEDPTGIVPNKEKFPSYMLEINVRFYREKSYVEKKVRITEEFLKDFLSGPEDLATRGFKEIFRRIWEHREEEKG